MNDQTSLAIVSFLVIIGYLGGAVSVLTIGLMTALGYWIGARRNKNVVGQIPQQLPIPQPLAPPASVPQPKPAPPPQAMPLPQPNMVTGIQQLPPVLQPIIPPTPQPVPVSPPTRQIGITATVFSATEPDNAQVAYPDVAKGWSDRPSVALPFHFHGARPKVQVWGPKGSAVCEIVDVGPWYDGRPGWPADPYWQTGARPHAESDSRTNGAGIDLSPVAALAVGISGKGKVDWAFVDASAAAPSPVELTAVLTKHQWPLQSECAAFYGDPDSAGWEKANLVEVPCPWPLLIEGKTIHVISIHSKCADSLREVLAAIWEACERDLSKISALHYDQYDGSFVNRPMRGSTTKSMHAYGCAIDFDAADNPFHSETHLFTPDSIIVQKFEAAGWIWGGRWMSPDAMHMQAARVHP